MDAVGAIHKLYPHNGGLTVEPNPPLASRPCLNLAGERDDVVASLTGLAGRSSLLEEFSASSWTDPAFFLDRRRAPSDQMPSNVLQMS